jgi:hypothetical protein
MMRRVAVAIEAAKAAGAALRFAHDHDLKIEEKNALRTSIVTSAGTRVCHARRISRTGPNVCRGSCTSVRRS